MQGHVIIVWTMDRWLYARQKVCMKGFVSNKKMENKENNIILTPDHSRVIHLGHSCTLHDSNVDGLAVPRQASSGNCRNMFCSLFVLKSMNCDEYMMRYIVIQ